METSPNHIARQLRSKLPPEKKDASWGYLAGQFPWFPLLHLLRASEHPEDAELLTKAALYQDNLLRLNIWLGQEDKITNAGFQAIPPEPAAEIPMETPTREEIQAETIPEETTVSMALTPEDAPETEDETKEHGQESEDEGPAIQMPDLSKMLQNQASAAGGFTFEPYHTVDYFASQGIKVDREADKQTVTQLDRQVKSFTEWLKTMKKLSYQPTVTYNDPLVEDQARTSLNNKEIVTEAMAEVWVKQGNYRMAAQVYAKLMLQHPEKTPYFAARLHDLKEKQ